MSRQRSQYGAALITVLLVFAIVATLAAALLTRSQADIERTRWLLAEAQAYQYALGAEALARQLLWQQHKTLTEKDLQNSPIPGPLPIYQPDNGQLAIEIIDLQGRININNISDSAEQQLALKNLFEAVLLKPEGIHILADWTDEDSMPRAGGAEDLTYLSLEKPYRTGNVAAASGSELLAMHQLTADEFARIEQVISALPVPTPININTAGAEVLSLIDPGLSGQQVVHQREQMPDGFQSVAEFMTSNATAGLEIPGELLTVTSSYYGVRILARFNEREFSLFSRLHLDNSSGKITLLGRTLGENLTINTLQKETADQDGKTAQPLL